MAKKEPEEPKGTAGVSVRLPIDMVHLIDRLAAQERRTRGNMVRVLLEDALEQRREQ